jgi:hypothetical protein
VEQKIEDANVAVHRAEVRLELWGLSALRACLAKVGYFRTPAQLLRSLAWLMLLTWGAVFIGLIWLSVAGR